MSVFLSPQTFYLLRIRHHAARFFGVAGRDALRGVVVAALRAAAALGLQVRQTGAAALDFASSRQRHALAGRFARFHLTHRYILSIGLETCFWPLVEPKC